MAIDSGEIVLSIDDSRVIAPTAPLDPARKELARYCDYLADGKVVLMRSPERHINHACDPNTFVLTLGDRRRVIARRDIAAGDEVTYDYCINGFGDAVWPCRCGAQRCRHTIHADFSTCRRNCSENICPCLTVGSSGGSRINSRRCARR